MMHFYLYFYVSNSHVLWKKHTEEIIALLFTYLYYLQIFTLMDTGIYNSQGDSFNAICH